MAIPFLQEANVDGILRVLRATGTIMDDPSVDVIRELHNGLNDAEMDAIVGGLNLGGSGGRMISSGDDTFILLDDDALPAPAQTHTNFLRVLRWQNSTTITTPDNVVGSMYWPTTVEGTWSDLSLVVGPDTATLDAHGTNDTSFTGTVYVGGVKHLNGFSDGWGFMRGGRSVGPFGEDCLRVHAPNAEGPLWLTGSGLPTVVPPVAFGWSGDRAFNGNDARNPGTQPAYSMGGFYWTHVAPTPKFGFYVGDYNTLAADSIALLMEPSDNGWRLRNNKADDYEWLNFVGSSTDYIFNAMVNGSESDSKRDPATHQNATFSVFGTDTEEDSVCAIVGINPSFGGSPTASNVLVLRCYDEEKSFSTYDFINAERRDGSSWDPVFRVNNLGTVSADGAFNPGGADVAEWVTTDEQYTHGTVLVVAADGTFTKSTEAEDAKIAGVVALKPGVEFGRGMQDEPPEGKRPMTVCGITPVICTTAAGDIAAGDRLVSSTDGMAQKAGATPDAGTILGKALGILEQPGEDPAVGEVSCLIILQ